LTSDGLDNTIPVGINGPIPIPIMIPAIFFGSFLPVNSDYVFISSYLAPNGPITLKDDFSNGLISAGGSTLLISYLT
jgi:hypothetical protein